MKKILFSTVFTICIIPVLLAQTLGIAPTTGNPVLKRHAQQELLKMASLVERMIGRNPLLDPNRDNQECPPEFTLGFNLVAAGDSLVIELDTFELSHGPETPVLTVLNPVLAFGTAQLDTTILLKYKANAGFAGIGSDTVRVEYSQPNFKDTIEVVFFVKRQGRVVVADPFTIDADDKTTYCLDDELDFPANRACSEFLSCNENYDGDGYQLSYFTSYDFADTCFVYLSSRFPGIDTVCVRICDDWTVCDTFKIPFIIKGDTISIGSNEPFFDDFSTYPGPYPTRELWLDNAVFKNNTMAHFPPSVGFVTFDGLDFRGDPYNISNGVGDRLTSKPIDLSAYSTNSQVSLRFYLAAKGFGLEPEVSDSLFLEFRDDQRKWVRVREWPGTGDIPLDSFPPFEFFGVKIDQPKFLHEAFQFRFLSKTSPADIADLWHLDYVYLGVGVSETVEFFPDLAFSSVQADLLKNYTSMPFNQFEGHEADELNNQFQAVIFNHFDSPLAFTDSKVSYRETTTNQNLDAEFAITGDNFPPLVHTVKEGTIPPGEYDKLLNALKAIDFDTFRNVQTLFTFRNNTQGSLFESNDTVVINTPFSNYFAHDDGTAESQVFIRHATSGGDKQSMAVKFHANEADTLKAVQIMFPHLNGDIEAQLFNLRIWAGVLDSVSGTFDSLVYEREFVKPFFANNVFDTLHGFTTYVLEDAFSNETPVFIPANADFFVEFQQASGATDGIPIGFDLQHPCNCNYSNVSGGFKVFPSTLSGALMIRPVFGNTVNTSTDTEEPVATMNEQISVFPNPTKGTVFFKLENGKYENYTLLVFNHLGQALRQGDLQRELDMKGLVDGIYYLQFYNEVSGVSQVKKIVLQQSH